MPNGGREEGPMSKKIRFCLALFLAFAVLVQYSFSPQIIVAYGLDNTTKATQAAEENGTGDQVTDEQKAPESESPADATEAESGQPASPDDQQAAEKQETKYPATTFSETVGGVDVNISAPEGALPEGTTAEIKRVSAAKIEDAVQDLYKDAKVVKAVDITFKDKDGNEIEPNEKVSVTFASKVFGDLDDAAVVHINDKGKAENVKKAKVDTDAAEATFKSNDFSIYAVVETGETGENARLTVTFKSRFFMIRVSERWKMGFTSEVGQL